MSRALADDPTPWLPKCFYVTPIIIQGERPSFLDQYCITLPDGQKNCPSPYGSCYILKQSDNSFQFFCPDNAVPSVCLPSCGAPQSIGNGWKTCTLNDQCIPHG